MKTTRRRQLLAATSVGILTIGAATWFVQSEDSGSETPQPGTAVSVPDRSEEGQETKEWIEEIQTLPSLPKDIADYLAAVDAELEREPGSLGYTLVEARYQRENCREVGGQNLAGKTYTTEECDVVLRLEEPYGSLPMEALKSLAAKDARAAFAVGLLLTRSHTPQPAAVHRQGSAYLMQALALSEHKDAFHALLVAGGSASLTYTQGKLDVGPARNGLALMIAFEPLGVVSREPIEQYIEALEEAGESLEEVYELSERAVVTFNNRRRSAGMEELL